MGDANVRRADVCMYVCMYECMMMDDDYDACIHYTMMYV